MAPIMSAARCAAAGALSLPVRTASSIACSCAETRGYEGIHGLGTARSRISAVWPTNGSSSATSATAERRDGIRPVVLAMRARASVATARSSSRIATSGCAAWRNTV